MKFVKVDESMLQNEKTYLISIFFNMTMFWQHLEKEKPILLNWIHANVHAAFFESSKRSNLFSKQQNFESFKFPWNSVLFGGKMQREDGRHDTGLDISNLQNI